MEMDPYQVLGLARGTDLVIIKKAYRRLALQHHPDKTGTADSSEFRRVQEAYETLSDESKKEKIDNAESTPPVTPAQSSKRARSRSPEQESEERGNKRNRRPPKGARKGPFPAYTPPPPESPIDRSIRSELAGFSAHHGKFWKEMAEAMGKSSHLEQRVLWRSKNAGWWQELLSGMLDVYVMFMTEKGRNEWLTSPKQWDHAHIWACSHRETVLCREALARKAQALDEFEKEYSSRRERLRKVYCQHEDFGLGMHFELAQMETEMEMARARLSQHLEHRSRMDMLNAQLASIERNIVVLRSHLDTARQTSSWQFFYPDGDKGHFSQHWAGTAAAFHSDDHPDIESHILGERLMRSAYMPSYLEMVKLPEHEKGRKEKIRLLNAECRSIMRDRVPREWHEITERLALAAERIEYLRSMGFTETE